MIPTPEAAAEALLVSDISVDTNEKWLAFAAAVIRERDRAILDEAERDCWNLAALRRRVLGE